MKAIIMAGGEGTRLRPLTCSIPKPMVPILGKPVMEHIIELLKKHGITEIGVTLQYLPQVIQSYFGDGSEFGVSLQYFTEESPMGTAGSVKNAEDFLDDDFIVISGDSLTDIDLSEAVAFHKKKQAAATLILTKVDVPLEYGVVITDTEGRITRFVEKPDWSEVFSDSVNTGIYILSPDVLSKIPRAEKTDFSQDLFPLLLSEQALLYGYLADGYWCDIGDINVYRHCHFDILDRKIELKSHAKELKPGIFVEGGAIIEEGATLEAPVYIGKNCRIKAGAVIEGHSVLGENNFIGENATLKRCVLWNGCNLSRDVALRGSVLCNRVVLRENCSVYEQSVIGDESILQAGCTVKPSIKIWPHKQVDAGTTVTTNLIWGTKHTNRLFGYQGIMGEINVDITPEFASRLGAAFGSLLGEGPIAIASDGKSGSIMLKSSLTAGLLSTGTSLYDMGEQPLPITRSGIRFYGLSGGIHISIYEADGESRASIDFLDKYGANLARATERKLEAVFSREDFKRCESKDMKEITDLYEYKLYYLREVINSAVNKTMGYKILICAVSPWGQRLAASAAMELKCDAEVRKNHIEFGDTTALQGFSKDIISGQYDMGVIIDQKCEKLILIDEHGRIVSDDLYQALCALIVMKTHEKATIAVDVAAPTVIDILAEKHGATVQRTKHSPLALMSALAKEPLPMMQMQFILNFDAVGALILILDYCKSQNCSLSELLQEIPAFYIIKKEVACPFQHKGKVIRHIVEQSHDKEMETTDGIKIKDSKGWVLILPDSMKPICRIIGEGLSEEYAQELTDFYAARVKEISEEK